MYCTSTDFFDATDGSVILVESSRSMIPVREVLSHRNQFNELQYIPVPYSTVRCSGRELLCVADTRDTHVF